MPSWKLLGPKIPVPVWRSRLLRAAGYDTEADSISWVAQPHAAQAWRDLDARELGPDARVLLLIHGTGLTTRPGFKGISQADFARLTAIYGDRILAYEHRAFAHHLDWNARDLCFGLAATGVHLNLDVLGMSRGGLVARYIAEGWAGHLLQHAEIRIHKLLFVATPNGGTPSARRDPAGLGAKLMKAWRSDARRVALVNKQDRQVHVLDEPHAVDRFDPESLRMRTWPMLLGSQDQLPASRVLRQLNGFEGPPPDGHPGGVRPAYFAIASVFNFEHGAPDPVLVRGQKSHRRSDIVDWALPAPNDLVVPTASVFAPRLGPHGPAQFPLAGERLVVLGPKSNATHMGLLHVEAVRTQLVDWLATD